MHFVVHFKRFTDDVWIGAEIVLPVFVAEKQDGSSAGLFVVRQECSSKDRLDAEEIEIIGGNNAGAHAIWIAVAEQDERHGVELHQSGEGVVLVAIVLDFVDGELYVVDAQLFLLLAKEDQLVAIGIRKRPQQHRMDNAENGGVGADAEGEGENGDGGKAGILAHHAESVGAIVDQGFPVLARRGSENAYNRFFPELQDVPKAAAFRKVALLLAKDAFHFALVVNAEIEGQQTNQKAKQLLRKGIVLILHRSLAALYQLGFTK